MRPFETTADLVRTIDDRGYDYRVLGHAPGGRPVVAISGGGAVEPGIVLTAGAHANEQAGVRAAVELIDDLDTERRVDVIPTRDPLGLDGYAAGLGEALGTDPDVETFGEVADLLETEGTVVHRGDGYTFALIGDYGFGVQDPADLPGAPHAIGEEYLEALETEDSDAIEPLKGRRVFLPPGMPDVEGAGNFDRAYTMVVSPDGAVRHLNRYFDSTWAPPETRCVRRLFADAEPGIFVDLHESATVDDRFWFTIRRQADADDERIEREIGEAAVRAIGDAGGRLASWEDMFGDADPDEHFFTPVEDGLFWLEHDTRDSVSKEAVGGLNATDFAAEEYGLAFTNETGVYGSFEQRVEQAKLAVQTVVDAYEARTA